MVCLKTMKSSILRELPPPPAGRTGWPWTVETPPAPPTLPDGSTWPKISIVTPSYNQAGYVEETIRAVLLQGYPDLQYILSEDCSTDNSQEIIRRYQPWLKILAGEKNRGMSNAINRGFEIADGDIVTWISSDDVYFPGTFQEVARNWRVLKEYGAAVGSFHFMDESSNVDPVNHPCRLPHTGPIDLTLTPPGEWRLHQVSTFYVRAALDRVGKRVREDLRHNMDRELIYRVAQEHGILLLDRALAAFRIHQRSKSWSFSNMANMAREYASIQYLFLTENPADNRRRRQIANYRIAKGYVKFAKYTPHPLRASAALFQSLFYRPEIVLKKDFWRAWLNVFRLTNFIRALGPGVQ